MRSPELTEVEHEITVSAPAEQVYRLLADVTNWPRIFPPTVHVERFEGDDTQERIRIWATADGGVRTWTSRRSLDAASRRITFRQEVSAHPVASMGGAWIIEPLPSGQSRIRLLHDYRAVDDDPDSLARIDRAVDGNSRSELAALKTNVEFATAAAELTFSFTDSVRIAGSAQAAYDFINDAGLWASRLPHVASVRLDESSLGIQELEMETRAKDGSTHTTKSYRVCLAPREIAYKQVTLPPFMRLHTGRWTFVPDGDGVVVSSQHTVVLDRDRVAGLLGPSPDLAHARRLVQESLSANSLTTLSYAKAHIEQA
jgi:aromatase